jgi:preprotein translocase subunit SecG
MGFIIGLLTFTMVVDCVALVLLVLVQLPKKEAGAGLAFGGAASDALFGAGSGTVLTKITKWAAGIFFALAIFLSFIQTHYQRSGVSSFQKNLMQGASAPSALPSTPGPMATPPTAPTGSNVTVLPPGVESTNLPAAPAATNITSPPPSK